MEKEIDFSLIVGENDMAITKTVNFTLEILAPADIAVTIAPLTQRVKQGTLAVYTVTLQSLNDFAGAVALAITGLPAALNYSANLVAGGTANVTVNIDTAGLAVQTYALTLTATA